MTVRLSNKFVAVSEKVEMSISSSEKSRVIHCKGPQGSLCIKIFPEVDVAISEEQGKKGYIVSGKSQGVSKAIIGTQVSLVANAIQGVFSKFTKELNLVGVGYRAKLEGKNLVFNLGYSHDIKFNLPEDVEATVEKNTKIILRSVNKVLLGQVTADIIALRAPDAYKGKGVRDSNILIVLKEAKKK